MDDTEDCEAALKLTLEKLKLDSVDLYLVHWPVASRCLPSGEYEKINISVREIWTQMESLVAKGLTKSIGVSNFNTQMLWDLLSYCQIKPVVNQIEHHPLLTQFELIKFCEKNDVVPVAYSPLLAPYVTLEKPISRENPNLLETVLIKELATKYQKTVAQILLNWGLQVGTGVIPKTNQYARLQENFESWTFALED